MSQQNTDAAGQRSAETGWVESEKLRTLDRWTWATAVCGAMALMVLVGIAMWGVARDFADVKTTLLRSEIAKLRSHAARTTINIQEHINQHAEDWPADLRKLTEIRWLRRHWGNAVSTDNLRLYSAVISLDGTISLHSDPRSEGQKVTATFRPSNFPELSEEVTAIRDPALTLNQNALDIALPILVGDREIGSYHTGMDLAGFQELVRTSQRKAILRWASVLAVAIAAGTAAGVSFYGVTKRITLVRQAFRMAHVRRLAELGQLAGAIAHEIRNPLNAMRLNLHVLERWCPPPASGESASPGAQHATANAPAPSGLGCEPAMLIAETNDQIQRIEDLIRVLLAYARPEEARRQRVELGRELTGIVDLLRQPMTRSQVTMTLDLAGAPAWIEIDPTRFRQMVINL
jgi:hypothetical protein